MLRRTILSTCMVASLAWGVPGVSYAQNDSPTKDIYFTFSQPVTVPSATLPAGRYVFRHIGANTGRTILQIQSADKGKFTKTLMTVQAARSTAPTKPEIRFMETAANMPPAVSTWWYPGQTQGWEFVYPREQALRLAKTSKQPVLTTANAVAEDNMKESDLVRVDESGAQKAYTDSVQPEPSPMVGTAQRGDFAAADQDANVVADASRTAPGQNANAPRTSLPRTASATPLVALAGLLALAAAFGIGLWRRLAL